MAGEINAVGTGWRTLEKVIHVIEINADTKWYHIHTREQISYNQYRYWAEKLVKWGYAARLSHGHNQHNGWTGYRLNKSAWLTWAEIGGLPF